ncbi:MAG: hypothetical protein KDK27_13555 [Leptospiraceae bacterium]|nr:hypothetical protein [Leptospiraceae bacterium]
MKILRRILYGLLGLTFCFLMLISLLTEGASGSFAELMRGQSDPGPYLSAGPAQAVEPVYAVNARVDTQNIAHETAPEYVSFALDLSQVTGGKWWAPEADQLELGSGNVHAPVFDFDRPRLDALVRELRPAYLRIGGSESDKLFYDLSSNDERLEPEAESPYHSIMTRRQWDRLNAFARRNRLRVMFTMNAGPSARDASGAWRGDNARELIRYTTEQRYPVDIWELGNELNIFFYLYGPAKQISAQQYRNDLIKAREIVREFDSEARVAGQSSAFWPVLGEPLSFAFSFMPTYLREAGDLTDIVGWHYYPQQSRRGLFASRRATPGRLLHPENLDEALFWTNRLRQLQAAFAPDTELWLGESGNAQYGGEPGVSDRYISGLWWLDQLGLLARNGHDVVVRQTLSGMTYGMIADAELYPRTDYWNTVLWKRLMGTRALHVDTTAATPSNESADSALAEIAGETNRTDGANKDTNDSPENKYKKLRVYAHCAKSGPAGAITILAINLSHTAAAELRNRYTGAYELFLLSAPDVLGTEVQLNGTVLRTNGNVLPPLNGINRTADANGLHETIPPLSYAFIKINAAGAVACQ